MSLALLMSVVHVALACGVTGHAVLRKRESTSVIGWVALAWLAPMIGSIAYVGFAINRIQRRSLALELRTSGFAQGVVSKPPGELVDRESKFAPTHPASTALSRLGARLTDQPLHSGNRIQPLENGDEAFAAMIAAIDEARRSVTLATYIFDNDRIGSVFLNALWGAHRRGVAVRILIDGVGAHYSRPTMLRRLRAAGLPVAAFLPTRVSRWLPYANLRNHRKLLIVDGEIGFAGGLNIREGHCLALKPSAPVAGLHFRLEGAVVTDLQLTFAMDWAFTTDERLKGERWFAPPQQRGAVWARGIPGGPDEDLNHTADVLLCAVSQAVQRVRIVTPYFLPDEVLCRSLEVTALRGIKVDIVLPAASNLPMLDWARVPQLARLQAAGCDIHLTPPPFDHSKLLVIDGFWSLIGSSNWDTRSLRLNFEFDIECYDEALAARLESHTEALIASAHTLTVGDLQSRSLAARLRSGLARLLSPYL